MSQSSTPQEKKLQQCADVVAALKKVYDPELPTDILELGLVYGIDIDPQSQDVEVTITLTSPNCPAAETIPQDIDQQIRAIEWVKNVQVSITFEPPFVQEMMSEEAQVALGFM